jgi:hypothetical protein
MTDTLPLKRAIRLLESVYHQLPHPQHMVMDVSVSHICSNGFQTFPFLIICYFSLSSILNSGVLLLRSSSSGVFGSKLSRVYCRQMA